MVLLVLLGEYPVFASICFPVTSTVSSITTTHISLTAISTSFSATTMSMCIAITTSHIVRIFASVIIIVSMNISWTPKVGNALVQNLRHRPKKHYSNCFGAHVTMITLARKP